MNTKINPLEQPLQMPLSWFVAFKNNEDKKTINALTFSEDFVSQLKYTNDEGKESNYLGNYMHNMYGFENSSEIKDESIRKLVEKAETKIKEISGFSVKEICAKREELEKLYVGKTEAPIRINLS